MNLKCKKQDSVEEHFNKFDNIIRDIEANGTKMEEKEKVCQLLLSMKDVYQPTITALETAGTELTIEFIKCKLLDAELKEKNNTDKKQTLHNITKEYAFQNRYF